MDIGNRIKQRRIDLGMTADDLAFAIGKSRATIYRYENGDTENLPTSILEPLAEALHTTAAYLMGWTNDPIDYDSSDEPLPSHWQGNPEGYAQFQKSNNEQYYLDEAAREMAQFMHDNPEYRVLFDASRKVKKEDIEFVKQFMDRFRD